MKKLLLLLIIPLLSFGQLGDFYSSQSHPKAKGLNFKIKKPLGFEQMEGDRPNILQKWIKHKDNNDLMQTFAIMIKKSPLTMNSQEWKSVLLDEDGVNILPDLMHEGLPYQNLKIQKKQYFEVDLCPGIYWESSYRVDATNRIPNLTEKIYINQYNLTVVLFLGDYTVIFGYNVINQDVLDEKLFYKWILSFVFNEQWDEK